MDDYKNKPIIRLALKCARVLLDMIDTILESLRKFFPVEGLIEIKKHTRNEVSIAELVTEAAAGS